MRKFGNIVLILTGVTAAVALCCPMLVVLGFVALDYQRTTFGDSGAKNKELDSERSREFMKMIYLLADAGGKWRPEEDEIKSARKSLTKMKSEYTVEFISLMARFQAASREALEELIRTPTIKKVIRKYRRRIDEQLDLLEAETPKSG